MQVTTLNKLKKGDYFKFIRRVFVPDEPGGNIGQLVETPAETIYVFDGYNRSTKQYSAYKFDDINSFKEGRGAFRVTTDFDF